MSDFNWKETLAEIAPAVATTLCHKVMPQSLHSTLKVTKIIK